MQEESFALPAEYNTLKRQFKILKRNLLSDDPFTANQLSEADLNEQSSIDAQSQTESQTRCVVHFKRYKMPSLSIFLVNILCAYLCYYCLHIAFDYVEFCVEKHSTTCVLLKEFRKLFKQQHINWRFVYKRYNFIFNGSTLSAKGRKEELTILPKNTLTLAIKKRRRPENQL